MIRSLILDNFRLHAHTELRFDSDGQIILVAGANGVGKSTLLEAILFALYGEGRHGRRNLDLLVRRGAELEGMSVELVFEVDQNTYRISRRRDGRSVTAVLYGNDVPLMEGPNAVTDAVVRLLGMDAVGFKVAVIAQQKELDGLASLRPSDRAAAVRRLLRLDAITAAKDNANTMFRRERELVRELRPALAEDHASERERILAAKTAAESELARCHEAVASLVAELDGTSDVETMWNIAVANRDRALAALETANAELAALQESRSGILIPDEPSSRDDADALVDLIRDVERQITEANASARTAEQRALVETELDRVRAKITQLVVADSHDLTTASQSAETEVREAIETLGTAEARLEEHKHAYHAAVAARDAAHAAVERLASAGGSCESCGQVITDEHRLRHTAELEVRLANAEATVGELHAAGRVASEARDAARLALDSARRAAAEAKERQAQAARDAETSAELSRRERTYLDQLDRLTVSAFDIPALKRSHRELEERLTVARDAVRVRADRAVAAARADELDRSIAGALLRCEAAERDVDSAAVGGELELRHRARLETVARHEAEISMQRHWERELLLAGERLTAVDVAVARREALHRRVAGHEQSAVDAANAALLLGDAADRLATRIRPMLEGSMSSLLDTMSGGRFDAVRIDDDYNVTVSDAGAFRPLSELSGGETDLVALALRLALSQAVADRAGSGVRFLILDECFGSQDPQRRSTVLSALRGLRDTYRQIFLISHVENIEDAADVVVHVETSDDRTETEVTIA